MQGFARGCYAKIRKNWENNAIAEIGEYSLIITDVLGNTKSGNFAILAPIVREFTRNFDDGSGLKKCLSTVRKST
jgi:hypothetical protein